MRASGEGGGGGGGEGEGEGEAGVGDMGATRGVASAAKGASLEA